MNSNKQNQQQNQQQEQKQEGPQQQGKKCDREERTDSLGDCQTQRYHGGKAQEAERHQGLEHQGGKETESEVRSLILQLKKLKN